MSDSEQELFLIEFLVNEVNIPSVRAMHDQMLPATTCVSFQILSLPPINIEQAANTEGCKCEGKDLETFNKGKSCLFALPTMILEKPLTSFPIVMSVYKKLPPGVLPDVMLIGTNQIQAKDFINTILKKRIFKSSDPSVTSKRVYKITTATGQAVGQVKVYLRISCFGKKIVTQFQIPLNKKPFLFKGEQNSPVIQCKKIPSEMELQEEKDPSCVCKSREKQKTFGAGEANEICCPAPPCSPVSLKSSLKPGNMNQKSPCDEFSTDYIARNFPITLDKSRNQYQQNYANLTKTESVRKCGCSVKMKKC